ncbi:hypothetical protein IVA98_32935 [Bradyrhizobium sp. 160]|uniref:hypothetical protein n=1 Tax=unclassified Bradyrhizobium TaxID=2631580 RepID=UPI001FF94553|nr:MULTISPECIES: hypothetical protein [unclassified Bradyrhizobium]MCK1542207.1 hypothetical protein [Bradyrhizobium sp. 179]MCK1627835.1 hypothetical protein [Bradyrhizobium sp. 160]
MSQWGEGSLTLGDMIVANATPAPPAAPAPPPAPVIPETEAAALARKAQLTADPKWRDEYLSGSPRHAKELSDLEAVIQKGNADPQTEMAIAGELFDGIQPSGHLAAVGAAEMLREAGVRDTAVIRQVLTGEAVSAEEHAAATETKARLMANHDFAKRYVSGDGEARREMTLLNVILSSPIKGAAA